MTVAGHTIEFVDHPSLVGHFPGNPIMPGVVLLEEVLGACKAALAEHRVTGLDAVKFYQPVRPGDRFDIVVQQEQSDRARFRCSAGDVLICSGILLLQTLP